MIGKVKRAIEIVKEFTKELKKQNISAHAGSSAFFIFVSLLPMLIMLCTILPFTPLTEGDLLRAVTDITPDLMDPLAAGLVREVYEKSARVLSAAAVATLWSAGKGVLALMRGLNDINNTEEKRTYLIVRIMASGYTLALLFLAIISLVMMVFGDRVVKEILLCMPGASGMVSFLFHLRFVAVWFLLTIFFAFIYTHIPDTKLRFREQFIGAMAAAILWSLFSWGFSLYMGRGPVKGIYGNLSIVIIVMLWFYFGMYIVFLGACLNCYLKRKYSEGR